MNMEFVVIKRKDKPDYVLPITVGDGEKLIHTLPCNTEFYLFGEAVEIALIHDEQQANEFELAARSHIDDAAISAEARRTFLGIMVSGMGS